MESPLWNNGKPFSEGQAWIQLILWAEFAKDTQFINGNMVTLGPGEFIMTQRKMAESMNWTQSTVNRFLKKLVKMNQCCINSESKMTRVSLNNYEDRQKRASKLIQETNQSTSFFTDFIGSSNNSNSVNNINNIKNISDIKESKEINNNNNINSDKKLKSKKPPRYIDKPKDINMVIDYFKEQGIMDPVDSATKFYEHYTAINWFRGKSKIKKWKMCVSSWDFKRRTDEKTTHSKYDVYQRTDTDAFIAYCTNCGEQATVNELWKLQQGSLCCMDKYTHAKPEVVNEKEKLKSFGEFQKGQEEPTERSRTPKRSSESLQGFFDSMSQSG